MHYTWKHGHVICYCVCLLMTPSQEIVYRSLYTDHVSCAALAVPVDLAPVDYEHPTECTSAGTAPGELHQALSCCPEAVMLQMMSYMHWHGY